MNSHPSPPNAKARCVHQDIGTSIGSADLKKEIAPTDLIEDDLTHAQEARENFLWRLFALSSVAKQRDGRMT